MKYLISFILFILASYGLLKAWPLIAGPSLVISSPENNATISEGSGGIVEVKGKVKRAAAIRLNGAPILPDQNGDFLSILSFPRGGSIITLMVTDRFGKTITETRAITY